MDTRRIVVEPVVSQALGALVADRDMVIRVLDRLRQNLLQHPAGYRANRDDQDPDFLFTVPIRLVLRGRVRMLRFAVNDTTSPDHFFVEAVSMSG